MLLWLSLLLLLLLSHIQILFAAELDPSVVRQIEHEVDLTLNSRDDLTKQLRYELRRVEKAHDDAVRTLQQKLHEFGDVVGDDGDGDDGDEEDGADDEKAEPELFRSATTGPAGLVAI